ESGGGGLGGLVGGEARGGGGDLLAWHLNAVALEDLPDEVVVRLDGLGHGQVAVRAGAAARPQVERGHVEEHLIRLGGLNQDDVALEVRIVLVLTLADVVAGQYARP